MFKNIKNVKKIIILIITIMLIIIGIYIKTEVFEKEFIKIQTVAKDNFGYTDNEQLTLEAKKTEQDLYEIELPENINTKEVNKVTNVVLENKSDKNEESINVKVVDNKIQLTKKQLNNYKINLDVEYKAIIKQKQDDGTFETINLVEKTDEEIQELEITDNTEILYEKTLKNEEQEDTTISLEGNVPNDAQLQVEKVSEEKIKEIFGDVKIDVAYDIKVLKNGSTEINSKDFEEIYKVSIENEKINRNSIIYHVKDDNTYEYANMTKIVEGNANIDAESFSIYAISNTDDDDEIIDDEGGVDSGVPYPGSLGIRYETSDGRTGSYAASYEPRKDITITVPEGGYVTITRTEGGSTMCWTEATDCQNTHGDSHDFYEGYYYLMSYKYYSQYGGGSHSNQMRRVRFNC